MKMKLANATWITTLAHRLTLLLCLLAGSPCLAQPQWVKLLDGYPLSRKDFAWAYDSDRDVVVLYGGNGDDGVDYDDTWEYDGTSWRRISTPTSPGIRQDHAMAYDARRGRIVLFGGDVGVGVDQQTWEYDGADWTLRNPATSPPARQLHAMVFHAGIGRVVLFGGSDGVSAVPLGDTWTWDGSSWSPLSPSLAPSPRYKHAMTYDSRSARVVLFGGDTIIGAGGNDNETWELDGASWTLASPSVSPPPRDAHDIAYDPGLDAVVLFGGAQTGTTLPSFGDTWIYQGGEWSQAAPALSPHARESHRLIYADAVGRVLVFGGAVMDDPLVVPGHEGEDFWAFDGTANTWSEVVTSSPPSRRGMVMAYDSDRGRLVMYGGHDNAGHRDDTWEFGWNGWERISTNGSPGDIHQGAMAYFPDPVAPGMILFGGRFDAGVVSGNLWRYESPDWILISGSVGTPVYAQAMVHDSFAGVVRQFGGNRVVPNPIPLPTDETWQWDGSTFSQVPTVAMPSARYRHAMAFAESAGSRGTLLFGGSDALTVASSETWQYDSTTSSWTRLTVATSGPGRYHHQMAYYPPGDAIVVFGGRLADLTRIASTWTFGMALGDWAPLNPPLEPEPRADFAMEYDAARGRILLYGGNLFGGTIGDTWVFLEDRDGDLIGDVADNCPDHANPDQADADGDQIGDVCDHCRYVMDPGQADSDGDCPPPPYSVDPACGDACLGCSGVQSREATGVRIAVSDSGADLLVTFDASLVPDRADHYNVYRGTFAALEAGTYDHVQLAGGQGCGLLAPPAVNVGAAMETGSFYYLVVPACAGVPDIEGSYGRSSALVERPHTSDPPINGASCP